MHWVKSSSILCWWLFVAVVLFAGPTFAAEFYTIETSDCIRLQGLILDVDETQLVVLTVDGQLQRVARDKVQLVVIHNPVENPILKIAPSSDLASYLRAIYLPGASTPSFVGWPIRFIENLVIFYDVSGQVHVLEMQQIAKLRPQAHALDHTLHLHGSIVNFDIGDAPTACAQAKANNLSTSAPLVRPTRILADQIQISEFLSTFEKGFRDLTSYQERTYLYAKQFLYDRAARLGFTYATQNPEIPSDHTLPVYVQWATGRPYSFQSFSQFGYVATENSPTLDPFYVLRSEVKSHFFHASFLGNLSALPAGHAFFSASSVADTVMQATDQGSTRSSVALNYILLIGADYGSWSFSIGSSYLSFLIRSKDQFREVLGTNASPTLHAMYTTSNLRIHGILSYTQRKMDQGVTDKQVNLGPSGQTPDGSLQSYWLNAFSLRTGVDYNFSDELRVSLDEALLFGQYKEQLLTDGTNNNSSFQHFETGLSISRRFGQYVVLRANAIFFQLDHSEQFMGAKDSGSYLIPTWGGNFEFVF